MIDRRRKITKHPQQWTKDEVTVWLKWCVEEYSIEMVTPDKFDMNGKALCLLNRSDFMERVPKNGDILYNALQKLMQKAPMDNQSPGGLVLITTDSKDTTSIFSSKVRPILPHPHGTPKSDTSIPGVLSPPPSIEPESASDPDSTSEDNEEQQKPQMDYRKFLNHTDTLPDSEAMSCLQKQNNSDCRLLWEFIHQLLLNPYYKEYVCWEKKEDYVFRINNPTGLAQLWGHQKNRTNMTYEKLSRALRYYYRMNIIKKVSGKRLTYKFMQAPSNIQKGQRGAKPHSKCLSSILCKQENVDSPSRDYVDATRTTINNSISHNALSTLPMSITTNSSPQPASASTDLSSVNEHRLVATPTDYLNNGDNSPISNSHSFKVEPPQDEPEDLSMPAFKRKRLENDTSEVFSDDENPKTISRDNNRRLPLLLNYIQSNSVVDS